jgi:hypothetical protein
MLVLAAAVSSAFLSMFGGAWACTPHVPGVVSAPVSAWTIAAAPSSAWTTVHWSARGASGTAFVGYVAPEKTWIYEDFHSDGALSQNTAAAPQNGVWTWIGTYTTPQRVTHGAVQWKRTPGGFRQGFGRMIGTSFRETAFADCRPVKR